MFSLTVNHDNGRPFSISGLAKLWGWSRNAVTHFLSEIGVSLVREDGRSKNSPKGQVGLQVKDKLRTSRGQVEFIDSRRLRGSEDKLRTSRGQVEDKLPSTNNDPDPEPDKKTKPRRSPKNHPSEDFQIFWKAYPKKVAKGSAEKAWSRLGDTKGLLPIILAAIEKQKASDQWIKDGGTFIPYPATWLNGERWEDEPPENTEKKEILTQTQKEFWEICSKTQQPKEQ